MKKTTCRDLRGVCDEEITGTTPEEMAANCRAHVMQMIESGDAPHSAAAEAMRSMSTEDQEEWHTHFVARFPSLPDA